MSVTPDPPSQLPLPRILPSHSPRRELVLHSTFFCHQRSSATMSSMGKFRHMSIQDSCCSCYLYASTERGQFLLSWSVTLTLSVSASPAHTANDGQDVALQASPENSSPTREPVSQSGNMNSKVTRDTLSSRPSLLRPSHPLPNLHPATAH